VEAVAGLEASEQSVLFRGKVLSPGDILADVGVSAGDTLNIVKGRRARPNRASTGDDESLMEMDGLKIPDGMDAESYKKALGNMTPEEVQKATKAMDELLDSDVIDQYFADEDKLEMARLDMLKNIDKYEQAMPGFKQQALEMCSDPIKWRTAMEQAKNQMVEMKKQRDSMRSQSGGPKANDNGVSSLPEEE
jgi:hypothetical protein